jgi:hypothetical protein
MANYCSTNLNIKFNQKITENNFDKIIEIIENTIENLSFWIEYTDFNNNDEFIVYLTSKWSCNENDLSHLSEVITTYCTNQENLNLASFTFNYSEPGSELYGDESGQLSVFEYEKYYDSEVLFFSLEKFQNDFEFSNSKNIFDIEFSNLIASDLLDINGTIFSNSCDMCNGESDISELIKTKGFENGSIFLNLTLSNIYEKISTVTIENFINLLKIYSPDLLMFENFENDLIKQKSLEFFLINSNKKTLEKCS